MTTFSANGHHAPVVTATNGQPRRVPFCDAPGTKPPWWLVRIRSAVLFVIHLALLTASYEVAYRLRFDLAVPVSYRALFWTTLWWVLAVKLAAFFYFGNFHGWWRYVTFADLANLLKVSVMATAAIVVVDYVALPNTRIPRGVVLMDCAATILLVGGSRSAWRLVREHVWPSLSRKRHRNAFMIGGRRGAEGLVSQIHNHSRLPYRVVGFLDDEVAYHGTRLCGVPFLGGIDDLTVLAERLGVRDVLVIADSMSGSRLRRLMDWCRAESITLKMIPPVDELLNGHNRLQVRDVDINDLLQRDPVELDAAAINDMLRSQVVMVTGAGGSIGSEICRQIVGCRPECLVLVERFENNLFHVERELRDLAPGVRLVPCVADVGQERRMRSIFEQHRPGILFHAAAHKHVPLMEHNPSEAIANNVLGTKLLADLAVEFQVDRFVMISTDKAVNPTSVMGVSKQIAERYVHALSDRSATKFVVVRFGNVLASAGSVVPVFLEQIRRGGPITVTHPDMQRFFMTIPEASQLVLQAAALGDGGEVFVLDMGQPVRILDLAHDLLHLAGLSSDDIEIKIVGPRPGEKLFEELYFHDEQTLETRHPKIRSAYHRQYELEEVEQLIGEVASLEDESADVIRRKLRELVPEYNSPEWELASWTSATAEPDLESQPQLIASEKVPA